MSAGAFGDHPPTAAAIAVRDELVGAIDAQLQLLDELLRSEVEAFNRLAAESGLPAVSVGLADDD